MFTIITSGTIYTTTSSWSNIISRCAPASMPYVLFNEATGVNEPRYYSASIGNIPSGCISVSGSVGYTYDCMLQIQAALGNEANHGLRIVASGTFGTKTLESWVDSISSSINQIVSPKKMMTKSGYFIAPSGSIFVRFEHVSTGSMITTAYTLAGQIHETLAISMGKR